MDAQTFIHHLQDEILHHEAVQHPFLKWFSTEPLTLQQIQTFGTQHYQLVKVFVNYMTNTLPRIPDQDAVNLFRIVFDDEFGQHTIFRSHPALYRNFLKALGLSDEAWGRVRPIPEVTGFIEGHLELTRGQDFLFALGAIGPGHEFSIPTMFGYLIDGIKKNTALSDEAVEYFSLHIEEDKEHAVVFNKLISRHVETEAGQTRLREGALRSLGLRKRFWDGIHRVVLG